MDVCYDQFRHDGSISGAPGGRGDLRTMNPAGGKGRKPAAEIPKKPQSGSAFRPVGVCVCVCVGGVFQKSDACKLAPGNPYLMAEVAVGIRRKKGRRGSVNTCFATHMTHGECRGYWYARRNSDPEIARSWAAPREVGGSARRMYCGASDCRRRR